MALNEAERATILDCSDIEQLRAWGTRALDAATAADVFADA
ncbi:MAG: hypothetical protein ACT4QG_20010 [Sporichthyaceae bacterium]